MASVLAYDGDGNVVASLDAMRIAGPSGPEPLDALAYESAGRPFLDIWNVTGAAGSGAWPEHLGIAATRFRVELDGSRIVRLVDRETGAVRDREAIERAVADIVAAGGDARTVCGSPAAPLAI